MQAGSALTLRPPNKNLDNSVVYLSTRPWFVLFSFWALGVCGREKCFVWQTHMGEGNCLPTRVLKDNIYLSTVLLHADLV